jgi:hypothetical protein
VLKHQCKRIKSEPADSLRAYAQVSPGFFAFILLDGLNRGSSSLVYRVELFFASVQRLNQAIQVLVQHLGVRLPRYLIEDCFPVCAFVTLVFHTSSACNNIAKFQIEIALSQQLQVVHQPSKTLSRHQATD